MRAAREAAQRLQALHHPTTTKGKCAGNEGFLWLTLWFLLAGVVVLSTYHITRGTL